MRYQQPAPGGQSTTCRLNNKMYEVIRKYPAATRLLSSASRNLEVASRSTSSSSCQIYRRRHASATRIIPPIPPTAYLKPVCKNVQVYSKVYTLGRTYPTRVRSNIACQLYPVRIAAKPAVARPPSSVSEPIRDLKAVLRDIRITGSAWTLNTKEYTRLSRYPRASRLLPSELLPIRNSKLSATRISPAYSNMYSSSRTHSLPSREPYTDVYKTGSSYVTARRFISTVPAINRNTTRTSTSTSSLYTEDNTKYTRLSSSMSETLRNLNTALREVRSVTSEYRPGTTYPTATRLPSSVPPTIRNPKPAAPRAIRTSTSASGSAAPPASTYRPDPVPKLSTELRKLRAQTKSLLYQLDVASREPSWCTKYGS